MGKIAVKAKNDDFDDEEEDGNNPGNLIYTYPLFYIETEPENLFACAHIFWARPYSTSDVVKEEEIKKAILHAGELAAELKPRGVIATQKMYYLRDWDKPLDFRVLKHNVYGDLKVFMVEGPRHDQRAIETGSVTVH